MRAARRAWLDPEPTTGNRRLIVTVFNERFLHHARKHLFWMKGSKPFPVKKHARNRLCKSVVSVTVLKQLVTKPKHESLLSSKVKFTKPDDDCVIKS